MALWCIVIFLSHNVMMAFAVLLAEMALRPIVEGFVGLAWQCGLHSSLPA